MTGVAFFDVDRTLIRRSSTLVLAPALRRSGLISRRTLALGAIWHGIYLARGVSSQELDRMATQSFRMMRGWPHDAMVRTAREELEGTLVRLAYPEALALVHAHRAQGEPCYAISASLCDVVAPLAERLGLDGAVGSEAEVGEDGRMTGRARFFCHAENKVVAARRVAAEHGVELAACAAYSDSSSDLPLLEAVGRPHVVNPDRKLAVVARRRAWPVLRFGAAAA